LFEKQIQCFKQALVPLFITADKGSASISIGLKRPQPAGIKGLSSIKNHNYFTIAYIYRIGFKLDIKTNLYKFAKIY
jgi:hypothetical protein